jgi:hypothetical protein
VEPVGATDSAEVRALLVDDVTLSPLELPIRPNALELQIDCLRRFATQPHRLMKIGRGDEGAKRRPQIRQQTEIEWSRLVVLLANGEGLAVLCSFQRTATSAAGSKLGHWSEPTAGQIWTRLGFLQPAACRRDRSSF